MRVLRERLAGGLRRAESWVPLVLVAFGIAIASLQALPHLQEPLWQDEAATLFFHVPDVPWRALTTYESPNSHMGFTAMLSAWIGLHPGPIGVATMRTLPLLLALAAIPVMFLAARRISGVWAGAIAALLFAQSTVTEGFATQLRGYAPSWFFLALALLGALQLSDPGRRRSWASVYVASCLIAVSILPTNLFLLMAMAIAIGAHEWVSNPDRKTRLASTMILLVAPPGAFFVAYAAVLPELARYSGIAFSTWSRTDLLANWAWGTLGDERLLVPLAASGLVAELWRSWAARGTSARWQPGALLWVGLLLALPVALLAMPNPPFPRTLTPFLPVWYTGIACAVVSAVSAFRTVELRRPALFGLLAGAVGLLLGGPLPPCRGAEGSGEYAYDLCYQYFRDQYEPDKVLDVWKSFRDPELPIVSNYEGYLALGVLGSEATVSHSTAFKSAENRVPIVVAFDDKGAQETLQTIGSRIPYRLAADTGYFNVYIPMHVPER